MASLIQRDGIYYLQYYLGGRCHRAIGSVTPDDMYYGRRDQIIKRRKKLKEKRSLKEKESMVK